MYLLSLSSFVSTSRIFGQYFKTLCHLVTLIRRVSCTCCGGFHLYSYKLIEISLVSAPRKENTPMPANLNILLCSLGKYCRWNIKMSENTDLSHLPCPSFRCKISWAEREMEQPSNIKPSVSFTLLIRPARLMYYFGNVAFLCPRAS